jgi:hypothetical protein
MFIYLLHAGFHDGYDGENDENNFTSDKALLKYEILKLV